jgi:hypothetical protein
MDVEMIGRKLFLIAGLVLAVSGRMQAQTVQQPAHPLKVYVSPESGQLFWPQGLPFYVKLSTSPDPGAPTFLLKEATVRAGTEARKSQTDALKPSGGKLELEMTGNQFMRWVNHATKDTFLLRFVSDGVPPKTAVTFSGAPVFTANDGAVFYGKGLSATLKSTDEHSGVETTFISIDGATFSAYVNPLQFSLEKKNQFVFYAVDKTGNAEPLQTKSFTVDLTPPFSRHSLAGLFQATILSKTAVINLSASDNLAGVSRIEYSFDGGNFSTFSGKPISMGDLKDGEHILTYRSIDQVANQENDHVFKFYLDRLPPEPVLTWDTDFYSTPAAEFISTRTKFSLAATDNRSGVKNIQYSIDGGSDVPYTQTFQLSNKSGMRSIRFQSTDQMDNTSKTFEKTFVMDVTPPVTSFAFEGKHYVSRNIHWITSQTGIALKAVDAQSGVARIGYTTAAKSAEISFEKPFFMPNEGPFTLSYASTDNVMNKEAVQSIRIVVDNLAPAITVNFGSGKIGSQPDSKNESVLDVYPAGVQLYLAATDASSGLKQISYALNGKAETLFSQPVVLSETGEFTLKVIAIDQLGNKQEQIMRFVVSDSQ